MAREPTPYDSESRKHPSIFEYPGIWFWREISNCLRSPCRYSRDNAVGGAAIPGGFCNDCNIPFRAGGEAYRHFTSKLHR